LSAAEHGAHRYYEGGASSVYFWEPEGEGFAACILFKKTVETQKKGLRAGFWDAIHVVEMHPKDGGKAHYKLTSTIMLSLDTDHSTKSSLPDQGFFKLSGSMTRQSEETLPGTKNDEHLKNIGRMLEEMENRMRDSLQTVYFGRTKTLVNNIYRVGGSSLDKAKTELAAALQKELGQKP